MATRYPRILIGSIALALAVCHACDHKDEPPATQEPPKVVRVADLPPKPPKGSRYDAASLLVQISITYGSPKAATQTHLSVVDDKLFFRRTPSGGDGEAVTYTRALDDAAQARVVQLVRDNQLVSLETIRLLRPPEARHEYVSASVKVRVEGDEHAFDIAGVTRLDDAATAFSQTRALAGVLRVTGELEKMAAAAQPAR